MSPMKSGTCRMAHQGDDMRIAVCDDEERFRSDIRGHIDKMFGSLDVIVDSFAGGKDLIARFREHPYDLVFLDIEMPGMDGITLAKELRTISDQVFIVFLTGHVEYALEGYEVNALRYLTKPVKEKKLREVLTYVSEKLSAKRQIMLKTEGEEVFVNVSDILYFEAQDQYVMVHTVDRDYLVRYNLSDYEKDLKKDGFVKPHRSYLVSLAKVRRIGKGEVLLEGDVSVPVSRGAAAGLKSMLYSYLEENAF